MRITMHRAVESLMLKDETKKDFTGERRLEFRDTRQPLRSNGQARMIEELPAGRY